MRHLIGLPPEISGGEDARELLPWPDVLLIEEQPTGSALLYRFTLQGEDGGDTWHRNLEDAKHQAQFEYGDEVGAWREIPDDVMDAAAFAIDSCRVQGEGDI